MHRSAMSRWRRRAFGSYRWCRISAHIADTKRRLAARDLPEQIAGGERAIRGVMVESNLVAGRQDLDRGNPALLEYGKSVTDACVDLPTTEAMLAELAVATRARRAAVRRA